MGKYIDELGKADINVNQLVDSEVGAFVAMGPIAKTRKIWSFMSKYQDARDCATYFKAKEMRYPFGKWHARRLENEYLELLTSTRIRKFIDAMTDEEIEMLVNKYKSMLDATLSITDSEQLLKIHDILRTGSTFLTNCRSEFARAEGSVIAESCADILNKAMGIETENESKN